MKKKIILISIILILLIIVIVILYVPKKVAVLGYHSFATSEEINNNNYDPMVLNINMFEKQLQYLSQNNYKTLTIEQFYCYKIKKCNIPRKSVLITMDDGYLSNYKYAFKLLKNII